jgi:hypothetical protein
MTYKVTTDHGHEWYIDSDSFLKTTEGLAHPHELDYGTTVFVQEWQNEWQGSGTVEEGYVLGTADGLDSKIPGDVIDGSPAIVRGYLAALFELNSRVHNGLMEPTLLLFSTSEMFLQDVQSLLIRFGIVAAIRRRSIERRMHSSIYELSITHAGMVKFGGEISDKPVNRAIAHYGNEPIKKESYTTRVRSIELCGENS